MAEVITFQESVLEGGWLKIKVPRESLGAAMGWIRRRKSKTYDLEIKEHRKKRSLDANAFAWVLIGKLAKEMGISPNEVYIHAIENIGGNTEIKVIQAQEVEAYSKLWQAQGIGWPCEDMGESAEYPGFHNLLVYYGSSTYDTKQMSQLIDSLVQDCKALDIETMPPDQLEALLGSWNEKRHKGT